MEQIKPQDGPQTMAAKSGAQILVYGGGAGGGKSFFQAYRAFKYHKVKSYNAALFRRTFTQLQGSGSLWDECMGIYPLFGGQSTTRPLEFTWPSPSRVEFRHLQHDATVFDHKSKQYAYLGFDEATDFTGHQFTFMLSRLRTVSGVPKQFVLTTNPDPDSYLRTWIDWWISNDGTPDPAKSGKLRFWARMKDEIVWKGRREDFLEYNDFQGEDKEGRRKVDFLVHSMTFIPATVYDNKILLEKDPSYEGNLKNLPTVERERYLGGNWDVKESAGDMFQRTWFRIWGSTDLERTLMNQDGPTSHVVQSVRWWDFAATPVQGDLVPGVERPADFKARDPNTSNPDWTVGVRLDRCADGRIIVADVKFARDTPGAIEALVERTAMEDGPRTVCGWWEDPGQASKGQSERLQARVSKHTLCAVEHQGQSKMVYAREPSRAAYRGEMFYRAGKWNMQFFNQLEQFPAASKDIHDDAPDALSGAWHYFASNAPYAYGYKPAASSSLYMPGDPDFWIPPTKRESVKRTDASRFGAQGRKTL